MSEKDLKVWDVYGQCQNNKKERILIELACKDC